MGLPWRVQAYLWSVVLAGCGLLAWWAVAWAGPLLSRPSDLPTVLLLGALAALAVHFPLPLALNHKTNVSIAVYLVAALLFTGPVAIAVAGLSQFVGGVTLALRLYPEPSKRIRAQRGVAFNAGQFMLATGLSAAVYHALLPHGLPLDARPALDRVENVWAIPAAAVTLFLVNTGVVAVMVALQRHEHPLRVWLAGRRTSALHSLGLFPVSVATALLTADYSWAPLVMAVPAAMLHLSLQNTLRMVKQAEDLARREAEAAALRELDRMKNDLLSTVSHELRTPLTIIHGYAARLQRNGGGLTSAMVEETASRILAGSSQLSRLVTDLGDYGRASRGDLDLEIEVFDLAELLRDLATDFEVRLGPRLRIETPSRVQAIGDEIRVAQVLTNLIDNAAKYAPEGAVVVRVAAGDGVVRVDVADEGPGIADGEQARVWEKFFRGGAEGKEGADGKDGEAYPPRPAPGSGIGLAVVKALVEAQGGHVGLESRPGYGACFWFDLPAAPGQVIEPIAHTAAAQPARRSEHVEQPTAVIQPRSIPAPAAGNRAGL